MGIFRAIGGSSQQLYWVITKSWNERQIFIIEAISNTVGSTISGVVIGMGIASLVSIQMNLLTEVPFSIYVPYWLLLGVFVLTVALNIGSLHQHHCEAAHCIYCQRRFYFSCLFHIVFPMMRNGGY